MHILFQSSLYTGTHSHAWTHANTHTDRDIHSHAYSLIHTHHEKSYIILYNATHINTHTNAPCVLKLIGNDLPIPFNFWLVSISPRGWGRDWSSGHFHCLSWKWYIFSAGTAHKASDHCKEGGKYTSSESGQERRAGHWFCYSLFFWHMEVSSPGTIPTPFAKEDQPDLNNRSKD